MGVDTLFALPLLIGKVFFVSQIGDSFALLVKPKEGLVLRVGLPSGSLDTLLARKSHVLWAWLWKDTLLFTSPGRPFLYRLPLGGKLDSSLLDTAGCSKYPDPLVFYNGRVILIRAPRWTPQKPYDHWLHFYTPDVKLLKDDFPADNYAVSAKVFKFMGAITHNCDVGPDGRFWCTEPSSWRAWVFSPEGKLEGIRGWPPKGWRPPRPMSEEEIHGSVEEVWPMWEKASEGAFITAEVWAGRRFWALKHLADGDGIVQIFALQNDSLLWEGKLRGFAGLWEDKLLLLSEKRDTLYVCRLKGL